MLVVAKSLIVYLLSFFSPVIVHFKNPRKYSFVKSRNQFTNDRYIQSITIYRRLDICSRFRLFHRRDVVDG